MKLYLQISIYFGLIFKKDKEAYFLRYYFLSEQVQKILVYKSLSLAFESL